MIFYIYVRINIIKMKTINKKFEKDGDLQVYFHKKENTDDLKFNFIFTDNCGDNYSLIDNEPDNNNFLTYCFNSIYNNNKEYDFIIKNYKYNSDIIELSIIYFFQSNFDKRSFIIMKESEFCINKEEYNGVYSTCKIFKLYRNTYTKDDINNLKYKYLNEIEKNNKLIRNNRLLYIYILLLFFMMCNNYDISYSVLFLLFI